MNPVPRQIKNGPVWVVVRRRRPAEVWSVQVAADAPRDARPIELDDGLCEEDTTASVSLAVDASRDPVWRLELAAHAYQVSWLALGRARQILATAGDGPGTMAARVGTRAEAIALAHALRALLGARCHASGRIAQRATAAARLIAGAILAWPALALLVVRHGGSKPSDVPRIATLHAVHGEWETRTRHLLPPAYDPGGPSAYLILGRPRRSLAGVANVIDPEGRMPGKQLLRPLDGASVARSLPGAVGLIARGVVDVASSPARLSLRECTAIAYRFAQGAAHRAWWRRVPVSPFVVLFAHTGTADTSLLEQAMQANGARTVHVVHGVSGGWNFAGVSDVAIFATEHDADLARRFPGYGRTVSLPADPPSFERGNDRWLLLTAYTHPMSRTYLRHGPAPDLAVLDWVGAVAKRRGVPPERIVWRPHPSIGQAEPEHRAAVADCARSHGFTQWPQGAGMETMRDYGLVLTTPSTVLLEALRIGKLPVLLLAAPMQNDLVYASYPLRAHTAVELDAVCDEALMEAGFEAAWHAAGPGRSLTGVRQAERLRAAILQAT